jgi:hypothetical protein
LPVPSGGLSVPGPLVARGRLWIGFDTVTAGTSGTPRSHASFDTAGELKLLDLLIAQISAPLARSAVIREVGISRLHGEETTLESRRSKPERPPLLIENVPRTS